MTSNLTNALDRILSWIEQHKPWYVDYLQPGLSMAEIEDIIKDLPIQLPLELYELYQWRNGVREGDLGQETAWLFDNWSFRPLQDVVASYHKLLKNQRIRRHLRIKPSPYFTNFRRLKIFHNIGQFQNQPSRKHFRIKRSSYFSNFRRLKIFYNIGQFQTGFIWINAILGFCPVIFEYFEEGYLSILQKYTSLTSMLLTMAECYETGAYYIDSEVYGGYVISRNPQKARQIWLKYNSKIIEFALQAVQQGELYGEFFIYFSDDLIEFKDSRSVEPLIQALQSPIDQSEDPFNYINPKAEISKILGELGDTRAVPALIAVLEDNYSYNCYYLTRVYAAKALGQLRDERATYPLVRLLQDDQSEVRRRAAWALGEIKEPRAIEPLSQLMEDEESSVREAATEALSKLREADGKCDRPSP